MGGRSILAWSSGLLAIVGGVLMVFSGYATKGFLLTALNIAENEANQLVSGIAGLTVSLAIEIVTFLIALGGVTVVLGGLALLARHRTVGRLLIMLGGGAGFFGLLVTFGLAVLKVGLSGAFGYAPYWVGLIMAVVARRLAKGI